MKKKESSKYRGTKFPMIEQSRPNSKRSEMNQRRKTLRRMARNLD